MSNLFLDSSALAKRYLPEPGTVWLRQQLVTATTIIVSRITEVEIMSAVARRHRESAIDTSVVHNINRLLERHFRADYLVIDVNDMLTRDAIRLLTMHPLRAYDAIQLATARFVNQRLIEQKLTPITFLCADTRLLQIATTIGLSVDNPNNHI